MRIFTEEDIETTFEWLEQNDAQANEIFKSLDEQQPDLLAYLFSDTFNVFSNNEKELLVFATLVIFRCTQAEVKRRIHLEELEAAETANYALVDDKLSYKDQLALYFNTYHQEDLLAFVEDFISEDEDDEYRVQKEAKIPLFVALKTIIDVMTSD